MTLVDVALAAASRGWRVFPLVPGRKTPRRALTGWEAKATSDTGRIRRWWDRHPGDNVGVATGPSGLVVVDLDTAKPGDTPPPRWAQAGCGGGVEVLEQLAAQHGEIPATWTVATPSGGRHLYFRAPAGVQLHNTAGRIGWKIDTRAHGGYVVAAGSVVDGHPYRLVDDTPPAPLPDWLAQLATPPAPTPGRAGDTAERRRLVPRARGYVAAALAGEVQAVLDAPAGTRNDTLYRSARALGRFVVQGHLPRHVVEAALQQAGEAAGLVPTEVAATVRSALRRAGGAP